MSQAPVVAQFVEALVVGGAENLAVRIANGRVASGATTFMYSMQTGDALARRLSPSVTHRELGVARGSIRRPAAFLSSLWRGHRALTRQVRRDRVDIVQSHLPEANFWSLTLWGRRMPVMVATIHNNNEFYLADRHGGARQVLRRQAYRLLIRRCAAVVAVSAEVKSSLVHDLGLAPREADKIVVIANGVEIPPSDPTARDGIRREFALGPDERLLVGAGRLTEQKNFGDLITVAGLLRDQGLRIRVLIAGQGEEHTQLEQQIRELALESVVSLIGVRDDLPRLFQAADAFVLPSLWEGLPLVMLEAMATGCPVVAYGIGGTQDVLTHDRDGLVVPVAEPVAMAAALSGLLADDERRQAIGVRGKQLIADDYGFQRVLQRHEELFRSIARGRRPGGGGP